MNQASSGPRYLLRWDHSRDQRMGFDSLTTTHRLAELSLFSNECLASLIDRYPRDLLQVTTAGDNPAHPNELRYGRLGRFSGGELITMIRRGRLCLRIRNVVENQPELARIVQRLVSELMECQPGLRTGEHEAHLEISSPNMQKYFCYDIKPQVSWQIGGQRDVLIYPSSPPQVDEHTLEARLARQDATPFYFQPEFDDRAKPMLQCQGEMLSLPQYTPYRIVNRTFCISLVTTFWTPPARRQRDVRRANYRLNQVYARDNRSVEISGCRYLAKAALLRLIGASSKSHSIDTAEATFQVDPDAPLCVGPLEKEITSNSSTIPPFSGLTIETSTTPNAGAEN